MTIEAWPTASALQPRPRPHKQSIQKPQIRVRERSERDRGWIPPQRGSCALTEADRRGGAGYHWLLWVGDTARGYYDDASLQLDVGILATPGIERVEWLDREEFVVGAPDARLSI